MGIAWRTDYEAARAEARGKGRLLLVYFHIPGRPLCKTMEDETFAHADVARAAERFVCVRVDAEEQSAVFEATLGGRGGLATCLADGVGDIVAALNGFAAAEAFLRFLEKGEQGSGRVKTAREASSAAPEDASKRLALAEAYRDGGSLRRAEVCYRAIVDGTAADEAVRASANERLARLRVLRGRNLEARKHLDEARRLDPAGRFAPADRLLLTEGLTLAVERRHREAAQVLQDARKRFPESEEGDHILFALGFVLHQDGQDPAALEVFESALHRYPKSSWLEAVREQIGHIRNPQPDHTH